MTEVNMTSLKKINLHDVIPMKYKKYLLPQYLNMWMFLAEVNKPPYVRLLNMTPHDVQYYNTHTNNEHIRHQS